MQTGLSQLSKVFLVEDSVAIRDRLVELLGGIENISIVGEASAQDEAVSGIFRTHPDAVVLDLQLLNGNGIDVMRVVHPREPGIRFIVLTNHASPQHRNLCMAAGASHFLDKSSEFGKIGEILRDSRVLQRQPNVDR